MTILTPCQQYVVHAVKNLWVFGEHTLTRASMPKTCFRSCSRSIHSAEHPYPKPYFRLCSMSICSPEHPCKKLPMVEGASFCGTLRSLSCRGRVCKDKMFMNNIVGTLAIIILGRVSHLDVPHSLMDFLRPSGQNKSSNRNIFKNVVILREHSKT